MFGLSLIGVQAQQALVVTGSDISSASGSVSYSIGQIDYISSGTLVSVSQGIQQSYGKLVVEINSTISITVWPNPVFNILNVKISDDIGTGLDIQLYNINGKLLESRKSNSNFLNIAMENFAPATYILLVTHLKQKTVSFKIIKY